MSPYASGPSHEAILRGNLEVYYWRKIFNLVLLRSHGMSTTLRSGGTRSLGNGHLFIRMGLYADPNAVCIIANISYLLGTRLGTPGMEIFRMAGIRLPCRMRSITAITPMTRLVLASLKHARTSKSSPQQRQVCAKYRR